MPIESQVINATGKTIITVNAIPDANYLFPALLVGATLVIAVVTALSMRSSNKKQDKQITILEQQSNLNAMLEVFKMLNNDTHKNAESVLSLQYSGHEKNLYVGQNVNGTFLTQANTVSRNYDQLGLLVERGLIPKNDYYEMFGTMTVLYHHILFVDFDNRRTARGERDYRTFFTRLAINCYEYLEKINRIPFDPLTGQSIPQTVLQQWRVSLQPDSTERGVPTG
ncbi:MAG: hypothetical protein WCC52_01840 [Nitrosotalea sp.]